MHFAQNCYNTLQNTDFPLFSLKHLQPKQTEILAPVSQSGSRGALLVCWPVVYGEAVIELGVGPRVLGPFLVDELQECC